MAKTKYCSHCGAPYDSALENCPYCGVVVYGRQVLSKKVESAKPELSSSKSQDSEKMSVGDYISCILLMTFFGLGVSGIIPILLCSYFGVLDNIWCAILSYLIVPAICLVIVEVIAKHKGTNSESTPKLSSSHSLH